MYKDLHGSSGFSHVISAPLNPDVAIMYIMSLLRIAYREPNITTYSYVGSLTILLDAVPNKKETNNLSNSFTEKTSYYIIPI